MEVLFEYRGSKRELTVGVPESLTGVISAELRRIGKARALVLTSHDSLPPAGGRGRAASEIYLLQKWSGVWNCFVDVRHYNEVSDGDRLAVIARPKPPSKVGGSGKTRIPKSDEIQTVDFQFRVLIEEDVADEDCASEQNNALEQEQSSNVSLAEGEQYVRGPSGRASWKMISHQECADVRAESEDTAGGSTGHPEAVNHVMGEGVAGASVGCEAAVACREEGVASRSPEQREGSSGSAVSGPGQDDDGGQPSPGGGDRSAGTDGEQGGGADDQGLTAEQM